MIQNTALVRDNSTLANFKAWASVISAFFTTAGWVQGTDTGQVNWSTIASVPAVNTYVFEIWKPGDGLAAFNLKVEYGTGSASGNTAPQMRLSIGTTTNGAGTLTGFVTTAQVLPQQSPPVTSTSTQWNCYFSGDTGRMGVLLWRDESSTFAPMFFGVQRSMNSSGVPTSTHVTLVSIGIDNISNEEGVFQQTLVFGTGVGNSVLPGVTGSQLICLKNAPSLTALFNGSASLSPVFPDVGYFDNPLDFIAVASFNDVTEGAVMTIAGANMPYGVAHNYVVTKNGLAFRGCGSSNQAHSAFLMRYD